MPHFSEQVHRAIERYMRHRISLNDLVVSPEFKLLVGGPKWIAKDDDDTVCVRKYIGIRDRGDFLAVYYLPRISMDYYNIMHSHYEPKRWLHHPHYKDHMKFASIRNPLGILNSSVFSINALTGEYIDNYVDEDPRAIREKLALYKLSDLTFFEGLVNPLLAYLKDFLEVMDAYHIMRWENLITQPEPTIMSVADGLGIRISHDVAKEIWDGMKFRNQTQYHRHNFRQGIVGDWKNHLVNEHLEMLKAKGFDEYLEALGYDKIEMFAESDYTPFQKTVCDHIRRGEPYEFDGDPNVFTFAFNKSNFRSTKFDFVSYGRIGSVEIERSSIKDEPFFRGFMEAVDEALRPVIETLNAIAARYST